MRLLSLLLLANATWGACAGSFTGTPCTATVGTSSRNYATPALCIADIPANLVTDGNSYVCELYNDSQFTAGFTIASKTTDSTHIIRVTAAPGQSYMDHADVRINALAYDQSKGVGISINADYTVIATVTNMQYVTIDRLQLRNTTTGTGGANNAILANGVSSAHNTFQNLILDVLGSGPLIACTAATTTVSNIAGIQRGAGGALTSALGCLIENSTFVKPKDRTGGAAGTALIATDTSPVARSVAVFGFATASSGTWGAGSSNNATDLASGLPGSTGNRHSVTWDQTHPFTDGNKATPNLIPITASDLTSNGYLDATNAPLDISGYTRQSPPTIGAWELTYTAPPSSARRRATVIQ